MGDPRGALKRKSMCTDEDGVVESSGTEAFEAWRRLDMHRQQGGCVAAKRRWSVWWFRPQNHQTGRFTGLGLKTGGMFGVAGWRRQRVRGAIAKLASR